MTPFWYLMLVICCLTGIALGWYHSQRGFNDAERKYGIRPPRKHWWLP